ncbi:ATP-binding cassette domain-containing protein [Enterococcus faecalis]|uniref:ATP-binding cassette domain-containing protein n=2 Tax=Bacteria TaxID=2 RepID=UPI0020915564|nr:ATP-binding cassette domain-containing protein [Enterococcus faecalis]MCO5446203.1 ATP-binding cassette domain-containing protein [Enterococcus faecalis]
MINIKDFSIFINNNKLLDSLSLSIAQGEYFCLIGESGGGKTLLGKAILDVLPKNVRMSGFIECPRNQMEIILQNPIGSMQSNIKIGTQFHHLLKSKGMKSKVKRKEMIDNALQSVGFKNSEEIPFKKPFELSGGMCQRIAIAMALVSKPRIIIADEPTSALDQQSQETVLKLLDEVCKQNKITLFFITHDLLIAQRFSTHIGVIYKGRLIESGPTNQVLTYPKDMYTKELIGIFE